MVEACGDSREQQAQPGHTIMPLINWASNLCEDVCYMVTIDCGEVSDQKARSG